MKKQSQLNKIALIFIIAGCIIFGFSSLISPDKIEGFFENIATELIGIGFTVGIVDYYYQQKEEKELKEILIRELNRRDNADALKAFYELHSKGWITPKNLGNQGLYKANLSNVEIGHVSFEGVVFYECKFTKSSIYKANFSKSEILVCDFYGASLFLCKFDDTDLSGTNFNKADLRLTSFKNSSITDSQLAKSAQLCEATMADGKKYDGRYRLPKDLENFRLWGFNELSDKTWASFYHISVEEYQTGQKWADENLHKYRKDEE